MATKYYLNYIGTNDINGWTNWKCLKIWGSMRSFIQSMVVSTFSSF